MTVTPESMRAELHAECAQALDALPKPVFLMRPVWDDDGSLADMVYLYVNGAGRTLYGMSMEQIVGQRQLEIFPSVRELGILARYEQSLRSGERGSMEVPTFDDHGIAGSFILEFVPVNDDLLILARDVSAQRRAETQLAEQVEHLRAILDHTRDGVARYGADLRFVYVNQRVAELSGIRAEDWIGRSHAELGYSPEDCANWEGRISHVFETGQTDTFTYDVDNVLGHGWWEATLVPEFGEDGAVVNVLSTNREVTERVLAEQRMQELATHDQLTGLSNRRGLVQELDRALTSGQRSGHTTGLVLVDVDRFKLVNDSRGHAAGDRLLVAISERLVRHVRGGDLVARPGGDEFVIVMRDLDDPTEAMSAAWRIVEACRAPFSTPDGELFATVSAGVAVTSEGPEDLLRGADAALYAAKAGGRDQVCAFNEDLRAAAEHRLTMEGALRQAQSKGQLEVWYQPEVDLRTGQMVAAEALLRWRRDDGRVLGADAFIDIAEDTGLIVGVGSWVFEQACATAVHCARDLGHPISVRVNFSALQLQQPGMLEEVDAAIEASGVDPQRLCAEITETVWLRATDAVRLNLDGLRRRGLSIAIDDFGTGYAALTYLRRYPVSVLKIDRSFVESIVGDERDRRLVSGIISLAHAVGVLVTAEGVETVQQARILRDLGCPTSQGYLFARAVPAAELVDLLDAEFPVT